MDVYASYDEYIKDENNDLYKLIVANNVEY